MTRITNMELCYYCQSTCTCTDIGYVKLYSIIMYHIIYNIVNVRCMYSSIIQAMLYMYMYLSTIS